MKNTGCGRLALVATLAVSLSSPVMGHGGGHTPQPPPSWDDPPPAPGPAPTGPKSPSSPSSPSTPTAPSAPRPSAPTAPSGGAGPTNAPTTRPSTAQGNTDVSDWSLWWRFNQHAFLNLKDAIWAQETLSDDGGIFAGLGTIQRTHIDYRPSEQQLAELVLPALLEVLGREGQPQVLSGCLTALARIGHVDGTTSEVSAEDMLASFLANPNQQMGETAAVSLGILGRASLLTTLGSLIDDAEPGQKLCGRSKVPVRTRAFAAYGMGILANSSDNRDVRRFAAHRLANALVKDGTGSHDLGVACVNALGLVRLNSTPEHLHEDAGPQPPSASREALLLFLLERFDDSKLEDRVRAHLPRAMAAMALPAVEGDDTARTLVAETLMKAIENRRTHRSVEEGCVIALGILGNASNSELDQKIRAALTQVIQRGQVMSRNLALISIAKASSRPGPAWELDAHEEVTELLLQHVAKGKSRSRSWAALALGVQGYYLLELNQDLSESTSTALRQALVSCGSPEDIGAYALALGLRRDIDASEALTKKLFKFSADNARGALALSLGMVGNQESIEVLQALIPEAAYRPNLLRPTVQALALLNDKSVVTLLLEQLESTDSHAREAVYAWALAEAGDVRAVEPIVAMLLDEDMPALARGIATLAVGFICERGRVPWNTPIAIDVNYPANPESLFSFAGGGILNIR